ncbi:ABC transporter permease [Sulfidibacter corallicola]|uniref:ABC transporter permease n=1 Tax=Sulfidibacter corallicola TaxID=2818388 RepID=A0A8A4TRF0_SULCO|nr:ABC transporter permease [Sulfidibacter corallicola]QTD49105.1 ABC transporter permease [Sulfidibacter corallicola]
MLERLWMEFRIAFRALIAKPILSLVILTTLALGIGVNTVIFSFLNGILLEPLPFPEPDRLMLIQAKRGGERSGLNLSDFELLRKEFDIFEDVARFFDPTGGYNISNDGRPPEEVRAMLCTHELFRVLGIPLLHGGTWEEANDRFRNHSVVLSHELFMRRYGGDPAVVGTKLTLDAFHGYHVYGVLDPRIDFPGQIELYRSMAFVDMDFESRHRFNTFAVARLKPGVRPEDAAQMLAAWGERLTQRWPDSHASLEVEAIPLKQLFTGEVKPYLVLLSAGVSLVLLLACANVCGLLLIRNNERAGEMAIRAALGATRMQLIREQLWEGLLLALVGGLIGLQLAIHGVDFLIDIIRADLPFWMKIRVDGEVLTYSLVITLLTALTSAAAGYFSTREDRLAEHLKDSSNSLVNQRRAGLGQMIVGAEVMLATLLLIASGLMVKSFKRMLDVPLGFDYENVTTFSIFPSWGTYGKVEKKHMLFNRLVEELSAIPEVESIAMNTRPPFVLENPVVFTIEGQDLAAHGENPAVQLETVSIDYFRTLGIPLHRGRNFDKTDLIDAPPTAIVSRDFANRMWPGENPLGKRLKLSHPDSQTPWRTVVGVVENVRHSAYSVQDLTVYLHQLQSRQSNYMVFIKSRLGTAAIEKLAKARMHDIDPEQSIFDFRPYGDFIAKGLWRKRLATNLFAIFGLLALVLAAIGNYAMMVYNVRQRRREIGICIALGAPDQRIIGEELADALKIGIVGIPAGLLAAVLSVRYLAEMLYGVETLDAMVFSGVPLILFLIIFAAAFLPAFSASRINPAILLRNQ